MVIGRDRDRFRACQKPHVCAPRAGPNKVVEVERWLVCVVVSRKTERLRGDDDPKRLECERYC